MSGPSEHLSWKELACKDGASYPLQYRIDGTSDKIAGIFELIREFFGNKPITVLSAYRTKSHNRSINGAKNSQHLYGRALDLRPPKGTSINTFYSIIRSHAKEWGITGLGRYTTFVHVDIRPSDRLVIWSGIGVKDS